MSGWKSKHKSAYRVFFLLWLIVTFRILLDISEFKHSVRIIKKEMSRKGDAQQRISSGPKVSIIVPTKNEEKLLPVLLRSIKSQTYSNIETIIGDCMSTDSTVQLAREFGARVIRIPYDSIGYASSAAAKASSGSILIRCDADSLFLPEFIEKIVRTFTSKTSINVVITSQYYYDGNLFINFFTFLYIKYWRPLHNTPGHMTAIRRDFYFEIGGYDPIMKRDEDTDLGLRIVRRHSGHCILIDRKVAILISARAVKEVGTFSYLLKMGLGVSISFFEPKSKYWRKHTTLS
jgi:glycosyltransferase involved in cell wall biosynthesis